VTHTDALIVGAGPAGLFQVFQLGLLDIRAHVVEALPYAGGQCAELYADKPIYDIPGIPVCSGRELVERLHTQIAPFTPSFHFGQLVSHIQRQPDGRLLVQTTGGLEFLCRTVFIAAGVGAFVPRTLKLEGADQLLPGYLHHHLPDPAPASPEVLIAGDNEQALQAAIQLSATAKVTLVHRRDQFSAEADTTSAFRALVAQGKIRFIAGQLTGVTHEAGALKAVQVLDSEGNTRSVDTQQLLLLLGLSPKLGPVADWGLAMERRQLQVAPESFATSEPGIFAVGDVNTYPGKKKLILCGFHETVLAAFAAATLIRDGKTPLLQYTTTSTHLHALLGLTKTSADSKS
jgi:thioredoxin reductase (NADPH)